MHLSLIDLLITCFGLSGFFIAYHIYHHKHKKKALICPIRFHCDQVVSSDYSKLFGIPVEFLGMLYYTIIFTFHACAAFIPGIFNISAMYGILILSAIAFFFSLYLIYVQAFIIKKWCIWCIASATLCAIIFVTTALFAM